MKAIAGPHLVRYGMAAEQKYLVGEFLATYDQLVVNASLVAYMPGALASFITQRARNKPYLIDPQTHAFQHDASFLESRAEKSGGKLKRSIKALIEAYGEPISGQVNDVDRNSVLPDDFESDAIRGEFCRRVLTFQASRIGDEVEDSDAAKYFEFLKKEIGAKTPHFRPSVLVAPYFYLSANTFDEWLGVNLKCAFDSAPVAETMGLPFAVEIVIGREVLSTDSLRARLIEEYTKLKPSVYLVWISGFSEHGASEAELVSLIDLFRSLGKVAGVVNLHGGFFSVALKKCGVVRAIAGVAHGAEYGEEREVVPVGGGIHIPRFYLPALHSRLAFRDAVRAVQAVGGFASVDAFRNRVCGCKECLRVIESNPEEEFRLYGESKPVSFMRSQQPVVMEFPLTKTKDHCVRHYMWCKHDEYRTPLKREEVVAALREARGVFRRPLGMAAAHCATWERVLSSQA